MRNGSGKKHDKNVRYLIWFDKALLSKNKFLTRLIQRREENVKSFDSFKFVRPL